MTSKKRAIDKIYKRRDRYEIPDWQREDVWNADKKRALIDSILRDWKLPKFYFQKTSADPDEYEVVDGQQRLIAVFEFFDSELTLSKKSAQAFGGESYDDLPEDVSDKFDDFEIEYDEIEDATETEIKEFFQRLQEGLPLTSSEKLNSVHSKLRDFAKKLAKHSFFKKKVAVSDKRYAHFDIASKVAAIAIDGVDTGLRFDDLEATFKSLSSFSARSSAGRRLQDTFDYLDRVFPERNALLKNRTVVQSLATMASLLVDSGKAAGYEDRLRMFFESFMKELSRQVELGQRATDPSYLKFQRSVNANVKTGARTRQQVLLRKLLMFDPAFAEVLDPSVVAASGLTEEIKQAGESIRELVRKANERYAADNGVDLFKPTNKTTSALGRIGKAIRNNSDYDVLVRDLYFVFHEGAGTRLGGHTPTSFADVNALRTGLQHDLDHGKKKKAASSRKKASAAFRKYSAAASPETLAPERFPVVQANLLKALESDLRTLT